MTKKQSVPRHLWASIETNRGTVKVYRVYRHGNPKDVFQSWWLSTSAVIEECPDYSFDIRELLGAKTSAEIDELKEHGPIKNNCPGLAHAIAEAIEQGALQVSPEQDLKPLQTSQQ